MDHRYPTVTDGHGRRLWLPIGGGLAAAAIAVTTLLTITHARAPGAPPPPPPAAAGPLPSHPRAAKPLGPSPPVRLRIPKIGVNTPLMRLGLNPDHTLQVPPLSQAQTAGWYRLGTAPGAKGPAVIVGHVDSTSGPAVFYRLGRLRPGDTIRITRRDRRILEFTIDSIESVPKDSFPTNRVYGRLDYPAIRLITCGGNFNRTTGHYTNNVIAYGHLTSSAPASTEAERG